MPGPFTFAIDDAFAFSNGATVLVGRVLAGHTKVLAPCDVELFIDGESRGMIRLDAEQLSHPRSPSHRAVETRGVAADVLRGRECRLEHRPSFSFEVVSTHRIPSLGIVAAAVRILDGVVRVGDLAEAVVDGRTIPLVVTAIAIEGKRADASLHSVTIEVPDDVFDALAGVVFHARRS